MMKTLIPILVLVLLPFQYLYAAATTYSGDGEYVVNETLEGVILEDTVSVTIGPGAVITTDGVDLNDQSHVDVTGGMIDGGLHLYDDSTAEVSGGEIDTNIRAYDQSNVVMTGGGANIGYNIENRGSGLIQIYGGEVGSNVENRGSGLIQLYGGEVGSNLTTYSGSIEVYGGTIGSNVLSGWGSTSGTSVYFYGGHIENYVSNGEDALFYMEGGTLDNFITGFDTSQTVLVGLFDLSYGTYGVSDWSGGQTLSGTLADGSPFNNEVRLLDSATLTLSAPAQAVPDTGSTAALLGMGALALAFARRKLG